MLSTKPRSAKFAIGSEFYRRFWTGRFWREVPAGAGIPVPAFSASLITLIATGAIACRKISLKPSATTSVPIPERALTKQALSTRNGQFAEASVQTSTPQPLQAERTNDTPSVYKSLASSLVGQDASFVEAASYTATSL